tara:strand:+ start:158 stop:412 length:255 start_codon:yes stop_codon:yes gene_type:complete
MSHLLPAVGTEARNCFDVAHLAEMVVSRQYVTLAESRQAARKIFSQGGINRVNTITLMANGDLNLLSWGPRGGRKVLWKFGAAK